MANVKIRTIMELIEKNFKEVIETKNSWRKNEISRALDSSIDKALIQIYDDMVESERVVKEI
jgi:hypothetical protein